MPPAEFSVLERDIRRDLLDLTFRAYDGTTTPPLKDYLVGPKQVQARMMAHKGKVVFETYPGMNPTDIHPLQLHVNVVQPLDSQRASPYLSRVQAMYNKGMTR